MTDRACSSSGSRVASQRDRRRHRLAHAGEPPDGSTVELAADSLALGFCGSDEALSGCLQVRHLTPGRGMEPGIAQRKLGGRRNAIGQDWIDGPSLIPHEDADLDAGRAQGYGDATGSRGGRSTGRPSSSTNGRPRRAHSR